MYTPTDLFGRLQTSKKRLGATRQDLRRLPLCHWDALAARKFPHGWDALNPEKRNSRRRFYTPHVTGLTFLSQILSPGSSCREAVRQTQSAYAVLSNGPVLSPDSGAYCQARGRIELGRLVGVRRHLSERMEANVPHDAFPWSRPIKVVDGTCLNLPDTPANRARYPPRSPCANSRPES